MALQKFKTPPTEEAVAALRRAWAADAEAELEVLMTWVEHAARSAVPVGPNGELHREAPRTKGRHPWQEEAEVHATWDDDDMEDMLRRAEHVMCVSWIYCWPAPPPPVRARVALPWACPHAPMVDSLHH